MPKLSAWQSYINQLRVRSDLPIVIYDTAGIFSCARAWWMFRVMNYDEVYVLAGGLPQWKQLHATCSTEDDSATPTAEAEAMTVPSPRWEMIVSREDVHSNLKSQEAQMIDARPPDRFHGRVAEPRPDLRRGHIPGALNVFFKDVLETTDTGGQTFKSPDQLRQLFAERGVNMEAGQPIIASCASGLTACIVLFALHLAGKPIEDLRLYDGSWFEWGDPAQPENPVSS